MANNYDIHRENLGSKITETFIQKVSDRFKYFEDLKDSECSEDYDDDMFFDFI